jgi:UDP-N-acetylglucosamine 4,6-dehydratase
MATRGVDYLIHTAALKRIDTIEYNPLEAVRTNVEGTENVIRACITNEIAKATFVSTDKAVHPINFYGMTKGLGEKLWIYSNFYKPIFNVVRYGNVMGSRGSVLPLYQRIARNRLPFPITDKRMTRFWIDMKDAVKLVLMAIESKEGYTYVLKSRTFRVVDLARALYGRAQFDEIGMRPGEKLHEVLIGEHETGRVEDRRWYMAIQPEIKYSEEQWPSTEPIQPLVSVEGNVGRQEIKSWLAN